MNRRAFLALPLLAQMPPLQPHPGDCVPKLIIRGDEATERGALALLEEWAEEYDYLSRAYVLVSPKHAGLFAPKGVRKVGGIVFYAQLAKQELPNGVVLMVQPECGITF